MCQDPVMDCVDQIQRAEGMASEGRTVFSAFPMLPGSRIFGNAVLSQMSESCSHFTLMEPVTGVCRVSAGNAELKCSPITG